MNICRSVFYGLAFCLFTCYASSQKTMSTNIDSLEQRDFESTIQNMVSEIGEVYFDSGSFELDEISKSKLNQLVQILSNNPIFEILVVAHTDSKGNEIYNNNLSQKRAENIKSFLIEGGVSENRIYSEAFGEKKPKNKCIDGVVCDETLHNDNRRAEFVIFSD